MQHFSLDRRSLQLGHDWLGMHSVRPELCGEYSFEQPKIALCGGTVA